MTTNYTTHIQQLDNAHHLHPFSKHYELREQKPRVITKGEGVYLWDSEGNKILDGMAGLWCVQIGYGNEELAQIAYDTTKTLSYYNLFFQTTTPYAAELATLISEKTPPGLDQILFSSSGSEANDSAVKLIWYYWNLMGKPEKKAIISRDRSYHGSTVAGASMTGLPFMQGIFDLPLPRFHHITPTPHYYEYAKDGESEHDFAIRAAKALEDKILELGLDNVAALSLRGLWLACWMPPPEGYAEIERICRKYDILLWSDEVICGFGRLGNGSAARPMAIRPTS
ncbi:MAG: aminotransferase class III-fold pyridoxal phosphate-dependent enzyme [Parvularculaceae bacterium]